MGPRPLLLYTTWEVLYMISDQCSYLYRRWRFRRPSSLDILIRVMTDILCWWQRKGTHILAFRHGATTWVKEIILVCNVTARQRSFRWCVYLSTGEGVPCEHYPWCVRSHYTEPSPAEPTPDMGPVAPPNMESYRFPLSQPLRHVPTFCTQRYWGHYNTLAPSVFSCA